MGDKQQLRGGDLAEGSSGRGEHKALVVCLAHLDGVFPIQ